MSEACDLSAVEARRLIGTRRLSPVELLESCLGRIEAVNGALNAVVASCPERALEEARAAERAVMAGEPLGPLHGLPLGVKDLNDTEGLRTTYGSLLYQDHVPAEDEGLVARLRASGAIVVAKTNTPEFGAGANTTNEVYGPSRNPFDTSRTCGGSSGGSAVALATGMLPICTGSDTGGSLRVPAAFCGIAAIRATPGLVPSDRRTVGWTTFSVQGPMARDVRDASLLLSGMAGSDPRDPLAVPVDGACFRVPEEIDLSTLRVAFSADLGFAAVEQGIRSTFADRMQALAPVFGSCRDLAPPLQGATETFWTIRGLHFLASHLDRYREHRDRLGRNVANNVAAGLAMKPEDFATAMAAWTRLYRSFGAFFEDQGVDLLICPTTAVAPFPVEQLHPTHIDGVELTNYIQWADLTAGLTLTGHPVVSIPSGLDHTGTPFGLQVVGPRQHSDRLVVGAAAALERHLADDPRLGRPRPDLEPLRHRAG